MHSLILGSILSVLLVCAAPARAQTPDAIPAEMRESLVMTALAHDTAELYGVSLSLLGSAAGGAAYAFARMYSGDVVNADAFIALLGVPVMASAGLTMLAIAAGMDAGISWWNAARQARGVGFVTAADLEREQRSMRHSLVALYASGITSLVVGALCLGVLWGANIDGRLDYALLVAPGAVGGVGYVLLLAAAGMDGASAAWSGSARLPSVSIGPIRDGGAMWIAGTF